MSLPSLLDAIHGISVTHAGHIVKTHCPDSVSVRCVMASVTRASRPSRRDRRDAMQRRVLEATEQLVCEGVNFTELSVERLAGVAGISRSTFYVHFEDKSDLARRLTRT